MLTFGLLKKSGNLPTPTVTHTQFLQAHDNCQHRCEFCDYVSKNNRVHHLDRDPHNDRPRNLSLADPLCAAWQDIASPALSNGKIVYLPTLAPEDTVHLLRAIHFALHSPAPQYRQDAKALLVWLRRHAREVESFWGTASPAEFGEALVQCRPADVAELQARWQSLALVPPDTWLVQKGLFAHTGPEHDTSGWQSLYQQHRERSLPLRLQATRQATETAP